MNGGKVDDSIPTNPLGVRNSFHCVPSIEDLEVFMTLEEKVKKIHQFWKDELELDERDILGWYNVEAQMWSPDRALEMLHDHFLPKDVEVIIDVVQESFYFFEETADD